MTEYEQIHATLLTKAQQVMNYKRDNLSLLKGKSPVLRWCDIGEDVMAPIREFVLSTDVSAKYPSTSPGFMRMSEIHLGGDFNDRRNVQLRKLFAPVLSVIRRQASAQVGCQLAISQAIINTITDDSFILPHSDDFTVHKLSIRTHIPIITDVDSVGISWNPETLEPTWWHMPTGGYYALNNFEPHTVLKFNRDTIRCHLIVDLAPRSIYYTKSAAEHNAIITLLGKHGPEFTGKFNPNGITHSMSNLELRNRLLGKHGLKSDYPGWNDHLTPEVSALLKKLVIEELRELQCEAALHTA